MSAKSYTFSEIFDSKMSVDELATEFGYTYKTDWLDLPKYPVNVQTVKEIEQRLRRRLPRITLTSEMARREFIVAVLLGDLLDLADIQIDVEYAVDIKRLRGAVDYVLQSQQAIIVIEAKNDEMERGFRQLAAEMIGVAEQMELASLHGAVTTGQQWIFGLLKREPALIVRDLQPYSVPGQVAEVLGILLELSEAANEV